jgi:hypothetical protein
VLEETYARSLGVAHCVYDYFFIDLRTMLECFDRFRSDVLHIYVICGTQICAEVRSILVHYKIHQTSAHIEYNSEADAPMLLPVYITFRIPQLGSIRNAPPPILPLSDQHAACEGLRAWANALHSRPVLEASNVKYVCSDLHLDAKGDVYMPRL